MSNNLQSGDNYRGGYASSSGLPLEELRVATSTFENYVSGTVVLVFMLFFVFILLSIMTLTLMGYARYLSRRKHDVGFYNPMPMVERYSIKNGGTYSTLPRSDYSRVTTNPAVSSLSRDLNTAMSQQSITATSTML